MTALTLVMGFYELSARDKRAIKNRCHNVPRGRFIRKRSLLANFFPGLIVIAERKADSPKLARAEVSHGGGVVVTENHRNKTAAGGRMM